MKTVFTSSMVAHTWAQQKQAHGRNGTGSFYFEGPTIYSYGSHFPIATFHTRTDGERRVLFTTAGYSTTTNSKHIPKARYAIRGGVPVFNVPHVKGDGDNLADYAARVSELTLRAVRARNNAKWLIREAVRLAEEANRYAKWFALPGRVEIPQFTPEFIANVKAREAKRVQAQRIATEERARAEAALRASAISEWRAGTAQSLHWKYKTDCMLRVKGDVVQTSQGAEVPVSHAKRLWRVISRVISTGVEYRRNGHTEHVGQFTVDHISVNGDIVAGCHSIKYGEIERLARTLGLINGEGE